MAHATWHGQQQGGVIVCTRPTSTLLLCLLACVTGRVISCYAYAPTPPIHVFKSVCWHTGAADKAGTACQHGPYGPHPGASPAKKNSLGGM